MSSGRKVFVISGDEVLHLKRRACSNAGEDRRPAIAAGCGVANNLPDGWHLVVVDLAGFSVAIERVRQEVLSQTRVVGIAILQQTRPQLRRAIETRPVHERAQASIGTPPSVVLHAPAASKFSSAMPSGSNI